MSDTAPDAPPPPVLETWLRYDDVDCVRCRGLCGDEDDTVYVVGQPGDWGPGMGMVCTSCITDDEKARAVRG